MVSNLRARGQIPHCGGSSCRAYHPRIAVQPFYLVDALRTAQWSGDPKQMRDAIYLARAAGLTKREIARELRTTPRRVTAAITFPAT